MPESLAKFPYDPPPLERQDQIEAKRPDSDENPSVLVPENTLGTVDNESSQSLMSHDQDSFD